MQLDDTTLVLIKPDGVRRGLVGEILLRFERVGLEVVDLRMLQASVELAEAHYPSDSEWLSSVGQKTLDDYRARGIDPKFALGTDNPEDVGRSIKRRLTSYISGGRVVAIVLRGNRAVDIVRKMIGATIPIAAVPGTVRGDFSMDSPDLAESEARPIHNLVHASGTAAEAEREIELWFGG